MSRLITHQRTNNPNKHIVYLMTKSYRVQNNYSLFEAIRLQKEKDAKLSIYIVPPQETVERNLTFWQEQTDDLEEKLNAFTDDVKMILPKAIEKAIDYASDVLIDKAYLKEDFSLFDALKSYTKKMNIGFYSVESNVFVPVLEADDKESYSARTIRPKIWKKVPAYDVLVLQEETPTIGEINALNVLKDFIENKLDDYDQHNDPSLDKTSMLSKYLKYGFISPVTIYRLLKGVDSDSLEDFLEELIVRRELAYNFVYYNQGYDDFHRMTYAWAYQTMKDHEQDQRMYLYTKEDYLNFQTHDPYFNAAMKQMVYTGYMHSYMRMYWCKKIIEWSKDYETAYEIALSLNNEYFYDGNTPNGYCGVAWCFGKHDRAWTERDIFGKLRYMNANGLKRKFDIETYVTQMNQLEGENQ